MPVASQPFMCPPANAAFIGTAISNAVASLAVVFIMLISTLFEVRNVNTSDFSVTQSVLYISKIKILPFNWMEFCPT